MHSLVRFRDLLAFEIIGVGAPIGKGLVGRDAGEAIGIGPFGLKITHMFERILEDADTLILGYMDRLSNISGRDLFKELLEMAIGSGKHVYSLAPVSRSLYLEIFEEADRKGLRIAFPFVSEEELRETPRLSAPIALRKQLLAAGYKVAQIGSEHQSDSDMRSQEARRRGSAVRDHPLRLLRAPVDELHPPLAGLPFRHQARRLHFGGQQHRSRRLHPGHRSGLRGLRQGE
ncbi:MAG TPA: hypothetical protein EYP17_06420 [Candidatus Latescibacteria bacterium]|nr:hypothetical protein [Candidatus Latescibacterota bacterium]